MLHLNYVTYEYEEGFIIWPCLSAKFKLERNGYEKDLRVETCGGPLTHNYFFDDFVDLLDAIVGKK